MPCPQRAASATGRPPSSGRRSSTRWSAGWITTTRTTSRCRRSRPTRGSPCARCTGTSRPGRPCSTRSGTTWWRGSGCRGRSSGADDIAPVFLESARRGAKSPQLVRAMLWTRLGRRARSPHRRRRVASVTAALAEVTSHLPAAEARRREAAIVYLCSLPAWITVSEECELSAEDARRGIAWAIDTLVGALRQERERQRQGPAVSERHQHQGEEHHDGHADGDGSAARPAHRGRDRRGLLVLRLAHGHPGGPARPAGHHRGDGRARRRRPAARARRPGRQLLPRLGPARHALRRADLRRRPGRVRRPAARRTAHLPGRWATSPPSCSRCTPTTRSCVSSGRAAAGGHQPDPLRPPAERRPGRRVPGRRPYRPARRRARR